VITYSLQFITLYSSNTYPWYTQYG